MSIELDGHDLSQVRDILRACVPECEVWAFGSRVSGGAKQFSDLDLAVVSTAPLPVRRLAVLANAFAESDLPIKVDVVDWLSINEQLRQRITERHEVVFRPSE